MGMLSSIGVVLDPNHHFIPRERSASDYPSMPVQDKELLATAGEMRGQASAFEPVVRARLAELADPSKLVNRAYGRASADAAQASKPLGAMTPLQRAMSRASALSRIGMMGQNQILQQNLRDRVGMVRFGQGLLSNNVRDLTSLSTQQAESDASKMRANQILAASNANFNGTIAGGITGMFARNRNQTSYVPSGTFNTTSMMDTPDMSGGSRNA